MAVGYPLLQEDSSWLLLQEDSSWLLHVFNTYSLTMGASTCSSCPSNLVTSISQRRSVSWGALPGRGYSPVRAPPVLFFHHPAGPDGSCAEQDEIKEVAGCCPLKDLTKELADDVPVAAEYLRRKLASYKAKGRKAWPRAPRRSQ